MSEVQHTARSVRERRDATVARLRAGGNLWLASAGERGGHLIPVSSWWDGGQLTTSTTEHSRTVANIRARSKVRVAVGSTTDVLLIDAAAVAVSADDVDEMAKDGYERVSGIPRETQGYVYVQLRPERMQMWRGPAEFPNRTVMRGGHWLEEPAG